MWRWLSVAGLAVLAAPAAADLQTWTVADCAAFGVEAAGTSCGWLAVAEVRGVAATRTLKLPVVVAHATGSAPGEPVLYLHGGPGIATLDVVPRALRGKSWPLLRQDHDLVFIDYRGTGRASSLPCPGFETGAADPYRGLSPQEAVSARVQAAALCRTELSGEGGDPAAYHAAAMAEDAEALRQILGYPAWSIFATSYGTLPAAEMMRRWPKTVRAVILDSAFPPNSPNRAEQVSATAEAFSAVQARCNAEAACRALYPDIRGMAGRIALRLQSEPVDGRDGEAFLEAVWTILVEGYAVPRLPELLHRIEAGDDDLLRRFLAVYGNADMWGGYGRAQAWLANCHDAFPKGSAPQVAATMAAHPDLALGMTAGETDRVCAAFAAGQAGEDFHAPIGSDIPTLVFFGEFDPATPRQDALATLAGLSRGALVEVAGASHAPFYTDDCTRMIALHFLEQPQAPVDTACLAGRQVPAFVDAGGFAEFDKSLPALSASQD